MASSSVRVRIKNLISAVLSLLLFVFFTLIALLSCIYFNVFEPTAALGAMQKNNYFEEASAEFETIAWDISIPLGLPKEVIEGLVTPAQMRTDIEKNVALQLAGKVPETDLSEMKATLKQRVLDYFTGQGKTLNESQLAVLDTFGLNLEQEYTNLTSIKLFSFIGGVKGVYSKLILIVFGILAALIVVSIFVIMAIRKHKHRALRYMAYASISTTVALAALPLLSFITGFHRRLNLSPIYFKAFVVSWIDNALISILLCSLFFMLVTGILLGLISVQKKAMQRKTLRHARKRTPSLVSPFQQHRRVSVTTTDSWKLESEKNPEPEETISEDE